MITTKISFFRRKFSFTSEWHTTKWMEEVLSMYVNDLQQNTLIKTKFCGTSSTSLKIYCIPSSFSFFSLKHGICGSYILLCFSRAFQIIIAIDLGGFLKLIRFLFHLWELSLCRGFIKFLSRRSVAFFSGAFLVFLMKKSKRRRWKQLGKLMAKSYSQPVNLPGARPLMNPLSLCFHYVSGLSCHQPGEALLLKCLTSGIHFTDVV